ncbi:MAG: hypothetical protein VB084_16175 [Syntrophomonadaceae bacterium]|nr:hypothetical protein [Syntrophomonadaceae bacterium]
MHLNEHEERLIGFFPTNNMAQAAVNDLRKSHLASNDDSIHVEPYTGFKGVNRNYTESGRVINNEYLLDGEAFVVTVVTPEDKCEKAASVIKANGGRFNM